MNRRERGDYGIKSGGGRGERYIGISHTEFRESREGEKRRRAIYRTPFVNGRSVCANGAGGIYARPGEFFGLYIGFGTTRGRSID